jgi:predicted ABC-type ATPase
MRRRRRPKPPGHSYIRRALRSAAREGKPVAFIVAGHNGSGKSTLWYERLAPLLKIPLVNADRLMLSILPVRKDGQLPAWAQALRDGDERWQRLSQRSVEQFRKLIVSEKIPFAMETVFSHWKRRVDGSIESKADIIRDLQSAGYFVILLFVGLAHVNLSMVRVETRRQQGGHAVPVDKLIERFPRTQLAIRHAAPMADRTLMFDNSASLTKAFRLARVQKRSHVLYDCRKDPSAGAYSQIATLWLKQVTR